jgi:hypothetical protein
MVAHFFRIEQLFCMLRWRVIREWAEKDPTGTEWNVSKEAFITLIKNSKKHYPEIPDTQVLVNGIKCEKLRPDNSVALDLYAS